MSKEDFSPKGMEVTQGKDRVDPGPVYARPVETGNLPMILQWLNDKDVARTLKEIPRTSEELATYYSDESLDGFLVFNQRSEPVGVFGLRKSNAEENKATLERFVIAPNFQGLRYGDKMRDEMSRIAFEEKQFDEVSFLVGMVPGAERSIPLYKKGGFELVHTLKGEKYIGEFIFEDLTEEDIGELTDVGAEIRNLEEKDKWRVTYYADKIEMALTREDYLLRKQKEQKVD